MRRAVKINISKFTTKSKLRKLNALYESYRGAINFFIKSLWHERGKLDKVTLARLQNTRLSERYKSQALKQAIETVIATKKSAKALKRKAKVPNFNGGMVLDAKFVSIEDGRNSFDIWLKLSTLKSGKRTWFPLCKTKMFNKWMSLPLAKLIQGACLTKNKSGDWYAVLWIELPDLPEKTNGEVVGCDVGFNALFALSSGQLIGEEIKRLSKKAARKVAGSKARQKARSEVKNYINRQFKLLPWSEMQTLVLEDLRGIKHGKRKNRSRTFRRNLSAWAVGYVRSRAEMLAQENRVHLGYSNPYKSSQECSQCGCVDRKNRCGDWFLCVRCGHAENADTNAAKNHRTRFLGSLESPKTAQNEHCNIRQCFS